MAGELKHKDAGAELTQAEDNAIDRHEASGQTSNDIFYFDGTSWVRATLTTYLASQKNIVIPNDGVLQVGGTDGHVNFIPWSAAEGFGGFLMQPSSGNRIGWLALQPKGTEDRSQFSLYNSPAGEGSDYSVLSLKVDGAIGSIFVEDVGSPAVSITDLRMNNNWGTLSFFPITDEIGSLGTTAKRYANVVALKHQITQAIAIDHQWSGITAPMIAGTALTITQAVYVGGDSKMEKAIATGTSTMPAIALATGTISEDASGDFLLQGFFRDNTWTWSIGGSLYISKDTAGDLTQTKPSGSGEQVQAVGVAITADIIHFNPSYALVAIP